MESIDKWFNREVIQWRSGAAVVWSVISLPVVCGFYQVCASLDVFNPWQWLADVYNTTFSFNYMSLVAMVMVVNFLFFIYCSKKLSVTPNITIRRVGQMKQLLKTPHLVFGGVCWVCGAVLGWLCTCIVGGRYAQLTHKCAEDSEFYCINEHHLFLVLYGGYTGLMFVIYFLVKQNNVLRFPTIQQAKFFQVRCKVFGTAWSSLGHVVWQFKFFYILYYLFGHIPRDWIAEILSLKYGSSYRLDSLYGLLLDVPLLWQTLALGVFLQFTWSYGMLLCKIYHTEQFEFPISSMFDNFKNKCLVDALGCHHHSLVQALGFYDLNLLSKHSHLRRQELFSLSQPGGHPHNWNKILSVCLSVVNELSDQVQDTNWKILANAPVRHPSNDKPVTSTLGMATGNGHSNGVGEKGAPGKKKASFMSLLKDKVTSLMKKQPSLAQSQTDSLEARTSTLFTSCFLQIWAVEALSVLVVASFREDSYGVVQMSLKDIIMAMLSLQEHVEKHFMLTGGVVRRGQKDGELPLKYLLQSSLKSSIYRIVNVFGNSLLDIDLPVDTQKKLQHFLDYKE